MPFVRVARMSRSARRLLTEEEAAFCENFAAAGFDVKQRSHCYRLAFPAKADGNYEFHKLAANLLEKPNIERYLDELRASPIEQSKRALLEELSNGNSTARVRAAERIIENDAELGARDAHLHWAKTLCEAGAHVTVPLPAACGECGAPFRVTIPLAEMFPQFKTPEQKA